MRCSVNALGTRRRVPGYADKQATQQLAAELERQAAREQTGLVDKYVEHRKRPLAEHVDDYERHQLSRGLSAQHIRTMIPRVRKVLDGTKCKFWPDLSASRVQAYLAELRDGGLSIQTSNFYLTAAKSFATWMVRDGRAPENPLTHLSGGNVNLDRRHDRRAFADDELRRLLESARTGPIRGDMAGLDRAVLYQLAAESGLRAGELRSLQRASFDLEEAPPTVTVEAAYSKRGQTDTLPLKASTAQMLARWCDSKGGLDRGDRIFPTMPLKLARMLRADLKAARSTWIEEAATEGGRKRREKSDFLEYTDHAGLKADFHSLRHTYCSNLARCGVHPKVAQDLARHSDINLTLSRYTHTVVADQAAALEALPDLSGSGPDRQEQRATGTDDSRLPLCLPKNLPTPVAPEELHIASRCTEGHESRDRRSQKSLEKQGLPAPHCAPLHPVAPRANHYAAVDSNH